MSEQPMAIPRYTDTSEDWYYRIELAPGVWTPGHDYANVALTRLALRRAAVEGTRAVDLGTVEAMIPVLLCRRGAAQVTASDHIDLSSKIENVKRSLGVEFDYIVGDLRDFCRDYLQQSGPADIVVFSGVLYHMVDPLAGLLQARSLARPGGLVIVETAAVISNEMVAHFNATGRFYKSGGNFFLPTVSLLDYWLRLAHLKPLDCLYLRQGDNGLARLCVPCHATTAPVGGKEDPWLMIGKWRQFGKFFPDCQREVDAPALAPNPIQYDAPILPTLPCGSVDLFASVAASKPHRPTRDETGLSLAAIY